MSAQPCGCDPEAGWTCHFHPNCAHGRWLAQDALRKELAASLVTRPFPPPHVEAADLDTEEFTKRPLPPPPPSEQPAPVKNDLPCIQDMVIADIDKRKALGLARYGTLLQAFNGRDALRDAYEEALDLAQYLRQEIEERDAKAAYAPVLRPADRADDSGR